MIRLDRINAQTLASEPFQWAPVNALFAPHDAISLAEAFPRDCFKTVYGYDGEKGYAYEARALVHLGESSIANVASLSASWRELATELNSARYRAALSRLSGCDLLAAPVEINAFHYPPLAWLGPHLDLKDKLVTHILYFNEHWQQRDGGCLHVLGSSDPDDVAAAIEPLIGNSAVLVRSEASWHAVSPVAEHCGRSRRSVTVTFYHSGAVSTLWPPRETPRLHRFDPADEARPMQGRPSVLGQLRRKLGAWMRA